MLRGGQRRHDGYGYGTGTGTARLILCCHLFLRGAAMAMMSKGFRYDEK